MMTPEQRNDGCGPRALAAFSGRPLDEIFPYCRVDADGGMTYETITYVATTILGHPPIIVELETELPLWRVWEHLKLWPYQSGIM